MQDLQRVPLCVAIAVMLSVAASAAWAKNIDEDLLKKGMTLPVAIQAFGQPDHVEWVNLKGKPVLFIFYPTDQSDAVILQDGRRLLPLGFAAEVLVGWGKDFYDQTKPPPPPADPAMP
jgi:hypothetical protein